MGSYQSQVPSKLQFYTVETDSVPIPGFWSDLKYWSESIQTGPECEQTQKTKINIIEQFKDVFQGIGKLEGECHFHLKEGAFPKVHPARKASLWDTLKQELNRMEQEGIIEKVTTPKEWVNSIVGVEKKDVWDRPTDLNKAIMLPLYPTPTL